MMISPRCVLYSPTVRYTTNVGMMNASAGAKRNERKKMATQGFDYDVIVIGSGFGGSVAAMRATEKGYRVGVMEAGKRWRDEDIPTTSWDIRKFAWQPEAEMYGIQRMEFLDDVLVLCGAGVGGGSHVYGNTLYIPPKKFFDAPEWAGITDWADEVTADDKR